jgi:hypothetical protein
VDQAAKSLSYVQGAGESVRELATLPSATSKALIYTPAPVAFESSTSQKLRSIAANSPVPYAAAQLDRNFAGGSGSLTPSVAAALMVAASKSPQGSPQLLTNQQLTPIVAEAEQRWAAAEGAKALAALAGVSVQLADLPGGLLGETIGKTILIDVNAAGYDWFIDPTPTLDSEFAASLSAKQLQAVDSRTVDRMDLLTVVEHELGHELGLSDLASSVDDLMSRTLSAGVRRNPTEADAVFADHGSWM